MMMMMMMMVRFRYRSKEDVIPNSIVQIKFTYQIALLEISAQVTAHGEALISSRAD